MKDWMRVNKLHLNPDQMEVLVVVPYSQLGNGCTLILDGVAFPQKDQVHSFGVLLAPAPLLGNQESFLPATASTATATFPGQERPCQDQSTVTHSVCGNVMETSAHAKCSSSNPDVIYSLLK